MTLKEEKNRRENSLSPWKQQGAKTHGVTTATKGKEEKKKALEGLFFLLTS